MARMNGALLLLVLALSCSFMAPAVRGARPALRNTACDTCLFSWRMVGDVLADPEVVQGVVSFVEARCPEIGGGEKCKNLAEGLLPVVLQWLASAEAANQFCAPTCHAVAKPLPALAEKKVVKDGAQCALCTLVVSQVQQVLNNSAVFDKINNTAQAACAELPTDMAPSCSSFVNKYEPLLQALIANAPAEELCELLGVCANSLVARLSQAHFAALDQQQQQLAARAGLLGAKEGSATYRLARAVQGARLGGAKGPLGDSCDMCKMAVIEAHSLVSNPAIQQSIVNYTASLCEQFQSFNDTCVLYVQTYAPVVFSILEQYLVPDSLCVQIGVCPSKPAGAVVAPTRLVEATPVEGAQLTAQTVVKAVVSWVAHLRDALGAQSHADSMVTMEVARAAANAWSSNTGAERKKAA